MPQNLHWTPWLPVRQVWQLQQQQQDCAVPQTQVAQLVWPANLVCHLLELPAAVAMFAAAAAAAAVGLAAAG
jgi:hypothetical protein